MNPEEIKEVLERKGWGVQTGAEELPVQASGYDGSELWITCTGVAGVGGSLLCEIGAEFSSDMIDYGAWVVGIPDPERAREIVEEHGVPRAGYAIGEPEQVGFVIDAETGGKIEGREMRLVLGLPNRTTLRCPECDAELHVEKG